MTSVPYRVRNSIIIPPARTHALAACLRNYSPVFLHIWKLRSFWHDLSLTESDVDFQTFEDMETRPPTSVSQLSEPLQVLVAETLKYAEEFRSTLNAGNDEVANFWLRKTKKPVLSVLMVRVPLDDKGVTPTLFSHGMTSKDQAWGLRFFRGMNAEVSMPTGSLCSERNAIGTALAQWPGIRRESFAAIAVLSMTLGNNPTSPRQSFDALPSPLSGRKRGAHEVGDSSLSPWRLKRWRSESMDSSVAGQDGAWGSSPHVCSEANSPQAARPQPTGELNPIKPCGACTEWLKKIAEANPDFRVLMFEDSSCEQVYVRSVWGAGQ